MGIDPWPGRGADADPACLVDLSRPQGMQGHHGIDQDGAARSGAVRIGPPVGAVVVRLRGDVLGCGWAHATWRDPFPRLHIAGGVLSEIKVILRALRDLMALAEEREVRIDELEREIG